METKKVLAFIFSFLFIGAFAFVLTWGIINFNKVKEGMSGTGVYTQQDLNKAYEDGYNNALKDKNEYTELIGSYRDTITTLNDNISQLNSQISDLDKNNKDYRTQVTNLTNIKKQNETTISELELAVNENIVTINELNDQIATYQIQVNNLIATNSENTELITQLNSQIRNLQILSNQLQTTNDLNLTTISNLNNQIVTLNTQISDLSNQINANDSSVSSLNNKIAELEKSVAYYEQYIASLEAGEQVVATFEFNGSVYNIQILTTGSKASVIDPESTQYVIFNGWTVNGELVDLSTFSVYANTKFIASVTYKYSVNYVVDGQNIDSQLVTKNGCPTLPTTPVKDGYEFDGWSLNGRDIVDPSNYQITENVTFTAKFMQVHLVTFIYNNNVVKTERVRNGNYASAPTLDLPNNIVFNGWKVNNSIVNVDTFNIIASTTFEADVTHCYNVSYMFDDVLFANETVSDGETPKLLTNPEKQGYSFKGWSIDGNTIVDISTFTITEDTTFIALFNQYVAGFYDLNDNMTMTWDELVANKYFNVSSTGVLSNGTAISTFRTMPGKLVISNDVKSIYNSSTKTGGVLYNCTNLYSLTIPESVTSIGQYAFYGLTYLTELNYYAENVTNTTARDYVFSEAGKATEGLVVNIGDTVKTIPGGLFYPYYSNTGYIPNITEIHIGKNVESIGSYAFYGLTNLKKVYYNAENCADLSERGYNFEKSANDGDGIELTFGDNVKRIPAYLFNWSNNSDNGVRIASIHVGKNVMAVGNYALNRSLRIKAKVYIDSLEHYLKIKFENLSMCSFADNSEGIFIDGILLQGDIIVPETITEISAYAFYNYQHITSISMSNNVTKIGRYAFGSCKNLTSVKLSNNIMEMGDRVFDYCELLQFNIYDNAKYLGSEENPYIVLVTSLSRDITSCEISNRCRIILSGALAGTNITTITIPRTIIDIQDSVLNNCLSLRTVIFEDGIKIKSISDLFYGCSALESLTIPACITNLGYQTFYNCTSLTSIYIPKTITSAGIRPFLECPNIIVYCEYTQDECPFESGWNDTKYSGGSPCTVKYGYTYEQYLSEIEG